MFDGESQDFGFLSTFANIEQQESKKTEGLLLEIDNRLFTEVTLKGKSKPDIIEENDHGPGMNFRRFYDGPSVGYNAHTDTVEDEEIYDWQQSFTYLRPTVHSILPDSIPVQMYCPESVNDTLETSAQESMMSSVPTLQVIGKSIPIRMIDADFSDDEDGVCSDIYIVDGILDEMICEDKSALCHSPFYDTQLHQAKRVLNAEFLECPSPTTSRRVEIMSSFIDAIWPDVVDSLQPLIRQVITASLESGLTYDNDLDEEINDNDESVERFSFDSS